MGTELTISEKKNFKTNEHGNFTYEVEELETFTGYKVHHLCDTIYGLDDLESNSSREVDEKDIIAAEVDISENLFMAQEELNQAEDVTKQIEEFAETLNKNYDYDDYKTIILTPSYYLNAEQNARVNILHKGDRECFNVLQSAAYTRSCEEQRVGELKDTLETIQEFIKNNELKADGDRIFSAYFSC